MIDENVKKIIFYL